jgi:hypothetical protein
MSIKTIVRIAILALAGVVPAYASQSAVWTSTTRGTGLFPNSSGWGTLTNFNVEIVATELVTPSAQVGLWEIDSSERLLIDSTDDVGFTGTHGEGASLPLNGCANFRLRWQRNISIGKYTLELWCESTGSYQIVSITDTNTSAISRSNYHFSIGSFYEPTEPTIKFGAIRVFSSNVPTGSAPPPRLLSSGFGNLFDFEFEGSMTDSSPLGLPFTFSTVPASFVATPVAIPAVSANNLPVCYWVGQAATLSGVLAYANNDSSALTYAWSQTGGPAGSFTSTSALAPQFTASAFGTANLQLIATDANNSAVTISFKFGGVIQDSQGNVDVAAESSADVAPLVGPLMMWGTNPWSWFDNREKRAADQQLINTPQFYTAWWLTPSVHGTISLTNGSTTVTGSGTQFQTDFCSGGTSPQGGGNTGVAIYYPSSIYSGQTGYAHYYITGCGSQTSMTLNTGWVHTAGTISGRQYSGDPTGALWGNWAFGAIPANYYDNVLAYYHLYYRTGIDDYLNGARTLASRWFSGPVWDSGMSFNTPVVSGCCVVAGPGRGISPAGVVLWGLESGTNIWPGIRFLWGYEGSLIAPNITGGQIGDVREAAYISNIEGLCVLYDPSPPAGCTTDITLATDGWWAPVGVAGTPLETAGVLAAPSVNNTWAATAVGTANFGDFASCIGACYATTTNGSATVTLTGATWNCSANSDGTFFSSAYAAPNLLGLLWFYNDHTHSSIPGNSNRGDAHHVAAGDNTAYTIASCDSPTQVTLSVPYAGISGNHGLVVSFYAGFGTSGFMAGIASGLFGDWNYRAFQKMGLTAQATHAARIATDYMAFIQSTLMDTNFQLFFARTFLNCEGYKNNAPPPGGWTPNNDPACADALDTNVEIMHACVAVYPLTHDPALLTFCDKTMVALFCKPGFACAGYSQIGGTYDIAIDDWPIGIDITLGPGSASSQNTNKWFGYFFGISYADAWAVVRQGGAAAMGSSVVGAKSIGNGQVIH